MLKSYRIADSKAFFKEFNAKLKTLSPEEIDGIKIANAGLKEADFLNQAFSFFSANSISFSSLIEMIRIDFAEEHAL